MEMTTALLALTAAGRGDHWDTVDRWFRNTVVECQFRDPAALNRGYAPGEPKPWDDTRDIVNRSLGGFFWASPYEYLCWRIRLMTCCSGHAIWTLGKIADHAVMDDGPAAGISVNCTTRWRRRWRRSPVTSRSPAGWRWSPRAPDRSASACPRLPPA